TPTSLALSLHDALPISRNGGFADLLPNVVDREGTDLPHLNEVCAKRCCVGSQILRGIEHRTQGCGSEDVRITSQSVLNTLQIGRSEEHTSELQSPDHLV